MSVQGGNAIDHGFAYAGMPVDREVINNVSKLNKTGGTLAFGLGVVSDGDDAAKVAGASFTSLEFVGVVKYELNRAYQDGETFGAKDEFDMTVVTHGVVYVESITAANKDEQAYLDQDGTWRNDDNGGAATAIVGAKFTSTVGASELAKLSIGIGG